MVCLGNICRSPLADGLLQKKIEDAGLNHQVDSAGTSAYHIGEKPDARMRKTAQSNNCPIDHLRARQFCVADFENFEWIYVMDKSNLDNVLALARNEEDRKKVKLILNEIAPGKDLEVPDPYYGGENGFVEVYNLLDQATDVILNKLKA